MQVIKKTAQALILNLLIIVSFFVFVNCFGKQEIWPIVVSGMFLLSFLLIKIAQVSKGDGRRSSSPGYYRSR
ncbi:hypothetical protein [Cesiribacter andamanensis]|uniref:Uncharacterized protein n=1 Tax=Cesiribacter andamanensis AMV16 TaxID=1279009 RepID=M7NG43_9BACT|nr:hypothetical protein [Cesiribacter andamanensis]EMR00765.1 hypothetical protein ADICEAN_04117 [Cesiribacter andamanensis AMV16]